MTPFWDARVAGWVAARIEGCERGFGNAKAMGVADSRGNLAAGVVFHNWSPEAGVIEVSAAAADHRWATRRVLREGFGYAFGFCQAAVARCHEDNAPVRRLWRAFGAEEHVIPRLRGRTASEALFVLTQEAWAQSKFTRGRE